MGPGGDIVPNMDGKMFRLFEKICEIVMWDFQRIIVSMLINLIQWF